MSVFFMRLNFFRHSWHVFIFFVHFFYLIIYFFFAFLFVFISFWVGACLAHDTCIRPQNRMDLKPDLLFATSCEELQDAWMAKRIVNGKNNEVSEPIVSQSRNGGWSSPKRRRKWSQLCKQWGQGAHCVFGHGKKTERWIGWRIRSVN